MAVCFFEHGTFSALIYLSVRWWFSSSQTLRDLRWFKGFLGKSEGSRWRWIFQSVDFPQMHPFMAFFSIFFPAQNAKKHVKKELPKIYSRPGSWTGLVRPMKVIPHSLKHPETITRHSHAHPLWHIGDALTSEVSRYPQRGFSTLDS